MTDTASCLSSLIGLTDSDCPCLPEAGRPEDYNQSDLGIFITDSNYGFPLNNAVLQSTGCGSGTIWDQLQKAKDEAITEALFCIRKAIYDNQYASKFSKFSGELGQSKNNTHINTGIAGPWSGVKINPKRINGGCLSISGIKTGMSQTAIFPLYFFGSDDLTTPIETVQIQSTANVWTDNALTTTLDIEMGDDCYHDYYLLAYDATTNKPMKNKFKCCGSVPGWTQFVHAQGFQTGDLSNIRLTNIYASGMSLTLTAECKELDWICEIVQSGESIFDDAFRTNHSDESSRWSG